ncbi:histidine kinase [Thermopolyspora sp. NPDC052614]|uniref:sensor histidine kinase n=1 Tax=Thermopolyspora sp. NPDC052614 TaxID=3155682 RepID=UPI003438D036
MSHAQLVASPWDRIRGHWSTPTWLRTMHVMTGVPIALLAGTVLVTLTLFSVFLIWTIVVPLISLVLLFWLLPLLTALQRSRFSAFLNMDIPRIPAPRGARGPVKWLIRTARAGSTWRQIAYHVLSPLISLIGFLAVILAWAACLASAALAIQVWAVGGTWQSAPLMLLTLALFVAGPWLARGVTGLDLMAAEALLGPNVNDLLARRVETLEESRAEVIDAADAERRRIERDLHDGPQQRLVSLAMNLGMARATLTDLPDPAKQMIAQAHEEAKQALKELRDFVRGLHPAVLTDEGLDAALSGLAVRSPFPVRLNVDVPERPTPTVEAVAFFVVSEALTNVAKHARATSAEVMVWRDGDLLRVVISDDGRGGADPERGTGLRGLTQRIRSVDGALYIDSPRGGPTTITAELPCG